MRKLTYYKKPSFFQVHRKEILWTAVTILYLLFIFSRSMKNAVDSSKESMTVVEILQRFMDTIGLGIPISEHVVRKCAHFGEYGVLGFLLVNTVRAYGVYLEHLFWMVPVLGGFSAAADESLQLFQNGRSAQLGDVLLDFCGVLAGSIIVLLWLLWRGDIQ